MMLRAAIVLFALAVPVYAQRGGAHAGSFGNRGSAGNAGFSSHSGFSQPAFSHPAFSQPRGFARPAQPPRYGPRYGPLPGAGFRMAGPSSLRTPYSGNRYTGTYSGNRYTGSRFAAGRTPFAPAFAGMSRGSDRYRFDARRRQFQNWYVSTYPNWLGYPYLIDPGFYDWGDSDDSADDTNQPGSYGPDSYLSDQAPDNYMSDQNGLSPPYLGPYPNSGYAAPAAPAGAEEPAVSGLPLTVIFKSGRAPIKVRNYLMTAKVLTDLDSAHYEQIPLDQIDLAATQNFNKVAGVDFQVPKPITGASRD
jgi:hypothetical protein